MERYRDDRSMLKIERKIADIIEKNTGWFCIAVVTVIRLMICIYVRRYESGDFNADLLPWFAEIKADGGIRALGHQVGNYNIPYQILIALMTYLPFKELYLYKGLSIVFDYLMAAGCGILVCTLKKSRSVELFAVVYTGVLFIPTTIMNSAVWAQCDSIYCFFIVIALWSLYREKWNASFLFLGVAFAFKLQTIFIVPFFIVYYLLRKKFTILYFIESIGMWYLLCLPAVIMGRNWLDPFKIYFQQTETHGSMWLNFPSFWVLIGDDYDMLKKAAIFTTLAILGVAVCYMLYVKIDLQSPQTFLTVAGWMAWSCILFLPAMHERYSYLIDILLLLLIFVDKQYMMVFVIEIVSSILRYKYYLFDGPEVSEWQAVVYLVAWIILTWQVFAKKKRKSSVGVKGKSGE